jgi:hypothetical protein
VAEVRGTVRTPEGNPIEGVLVMGTDLNYAETDQNGNFRLVRPEMALFFWCTGFLPRTRVLHHGDCNVEMVLRPVAVMRASA